MKKLIIVMLLIVVCLPVITHAQSHGYRDNQCNSNEVRTLFGQNAGNGGYIGFTMGYSIIADRNAMVLGGRGAYIMGHSLGLGLGGYAFINEPIYDGFSNLYFNLAGGYGGFLIEPIIFGKWPVHLSFPVLFGAGAVAWTSYSDDFFERWDTYDPLLEDASAFLVLEPAAELEFNLVRWMRLSFYTSYRYTTRLDLLDVSPWSLNGWNAGMTLKLGSF